jgi:hypothetical protein
MPRTKQLPKRSTSLGSIRALARAVKGRECKLHNGAFVRIEPAPLL